MRLAFVLDDSGPSGAARVVRAHLPHLEAAGHRVAVLDVGDDRRARATHDLVIATSWRSFYAMFALDSAGYAQLVAGEPQAGALQPLAERARRTEGVERVPRPVGVDLDAFTRAGRGPWRRRVLVVGDDAVSSGAARRAGAETWVLGRGDQGDRRLGTVPLDAMPAVLRSCDVLFAAPSSLLALEMLACGGIALAPTPDEDAAVAALGALEDPIERERLQREGTRAAAAASWELVAPRLTRALEDAAAMPRPVPDRAELAAIATLLSRDADPATAPPPPLVELARHGLRLLRRTLRRGIARPRPTPPSPPAAATPLRAGEPVLFVGQPRYFRSASYDAVAAGWGLEFPVSVAGLDALHGLPAHVERTGARTCVVFEPELLPPAVAAALRARGVRLVAYSTEPLPRDDQIDLHWDQLRRLDKLRRARAVAWDLLVHFDPGSRGVVEREGFARVACQPLPVSEALFYPEAARADFDVCFLGWSTPHRERFLHPLEYRYRTIHVAHGLFDEEARQIMNRSRLVVNLHAHPYPNFENRCVQALFCGRPLLSEPLANDWLTPGIDFRVARSPEELRDEAGALLDHGAPPPAPRFDRRRFLVASLRDLLGAP